MVVRLRRRSLVRILVPALIGTLGLGFLLVGLFRPLPSYLVAATDLPPGLSLSSEHFTSVELDLGPIADNYVTEIRPGSMLGDFVGQGELVSKRLIEPYRSSSLTSIRIQPKSQPAGAVQPGSLAALWQVIEVEDKSQPVLLVPAAQVTAVIEPDGLFASDSSEFELLISQEQTTEVIAAIASDSPLFIVPVS